MNVLLWKHHGSGTSSEDPYSLATETTFSRNIIPIHTLYHPQELTRMARITVWKPHRHVLIHLYKAFISVAHAEACQTRDMAWHYDNSYVRGTMNSARDISQVLSAPWDVVLTKHIGSKSLDFLSIDVQNFHSIRSPITFSHALPEEKCAAFVIKRPLWSIP